jgi:hypothetical protein
MNKMLQALLSIACVTVLLGAVTSCCRKKCAAQKPSETTQDVSTAGKEVMEEVKK